MVRSFAFLPVLLCAAVTLAAQAPAQDRPAGNPPQEPAAQAPTQKPAPPSTPAAASDKVTYSGCVKPGTTPDSWILESAELAPAKPGSSVGTSGGSKATLSLTTKAGTDLKAHANHKVEVSGTIAAAKPAAPASPGAASSAPRQELTVDAVKMVSTTCP